MLRLPLAESLAVTTLIDDPFLNNTYAFDADSLISSTSFWRSGDRGNSSILIFSKMFKLCPRVPEAIITLVPGKSMQRTQQNIANRNVFPCNVLSLKLFIFKFLRFIFPQVQHIFSPPKARVVDTRGLIIALIALTTYALRWCVISHLPRYWHLSVYRFCPLIARILLCGEAVLTSRGDVAEKIAYVHHED